MQWLLKQKGGRGAVVKMSLLTALWLVVTFVFAAEIYLSTRGGPIKISWAIAASNAFHDWFPWILLSPVAVVLAGKFRFGRGAWGRSLIVHFAACLLFTAAYEGLLTAANTDHIFLAPDGVGIAAAGGSGAPLPDQSGGFAGDFVTAFGPATTPPNAVFLERGVVLRNGAGAISFPVDSNAFAIRAGIPAGLPPPTNGLRVIFGSSFRSSRWTRFLHLAMMRTQFTIPIYWCIVCICWAVGHFQEAGERERRTLELEARLTQANLQALKMQLQPHFLFNTLNAISSLIHESPKAADDMIGSLSQFLRTTLELSAKNEISLRAELDFLARYTEIQRTRFGERLKIQNDIEPGVLDALVPPLILQPLVENAIRHGIESRECGGTVTIRASKKDTTLLLEISDDGEGFSGGQLLRPANGVGLSNTGARLQALYGERHQLALTANQPNGASVKIEVPFRLPQPNSRNGYEHSNTDC